MSAKGFTSNFLSLIKKVEKDNACCISPFALQTLISSSPITLDSRATNVIFNGDETTIWIAPVVDDAIIGLPFFIKNRGTAILTINSNTGGNDFYTNLPTNTIVLNPGDAVILLSDGTYINVE